MIPTREQFKEFIAAIRRAQEKEEKVNEAFKLIWDDDQGQYPPFYISPLWTVVYDAFNMMFGIEDIEGVGNELPWWLDEAPTNEARYWIDEKEYNISDIDAFYDYLVEKAKESDDAEEIILRDLHDFEETERKRNNETE